MTDSLAFSAPRLGSRYQRRRGTHVPGPCQRARTSLVYWPARATASEKMAASVVEETDEKRTATAATTRYCAPVRATAERKAASMGFNDPASSTSTAPSRAP